VLKEAYPSKPVKVIVPFAPGGTSDVTARIIFNEMSKDTGKQFYIENHAGAGANIGITLACTRRAGRLHRAAELIELWLNPAPIRSSPTIHPGTSSRSRWSRPPPNSLVCIRRCR